jgi:hypothetical protein
MVSEERLKSQLLDETESRELYENAGFVRGKAGVVHALTGRRSVTA